MAGFYHTTPQITFFSKVNSLFVDTSTESQFINYPSGVDVY